MDAKNTYDQYKEDVDPDSTMEDANPTRKCDAGQIAGQTTIGAGKTLALPSTNGTSSLALPASVVPPSPSAKQDPKRPKTLNGAADKSIVKSNVSGAMNIMYWDCRGAGKPAIDQELHDLAKQFAPIVLCVVETQISKPHVEGLAGTLGFDKGYAVSSNDRSGGIRMFWNNDINVDVFGYSEYNIDAKISIQGHDD